jgi:hypothetical protein
MFVLGVSRETGLTQQMVATIRNSLDATADAQVALATISDRLTLFDLARKLEIVYSDLDGLPLGRLFGNCVPPLRECPALAIASGARTASHGLCSSAQAEC